MASPTADAIAELTRSTALLTTGLNQLHNLVSQIGTQVGGIVKLYAPVAFQQFERAAMDATAALGKILTPALDKFTVLIRGIGDVFASLSPQTQKLIQGMAAAAIGLGVMTAAVVALELALSTATGGAAAVVGAVGGMLAGLLFASKSLGEVRSAVEAAMRPLTAVLNAFGQAAATAVTLLRPVLDAVAALGPKVAAGVESLAARVLPVVARVSYLVAESFGKLLPSLDPILTAVARFAALAAETVGANLAAMLPVVTQLASVLADLAPAVVSFAGAVFTFQSAILRAVAPVLRALADLLSPVAAAFGALLTALGTGLSFLGGLISGVTKVFVAGFGPFLQALSGVGGAFSELQRALGDLAPLLARVASEVGRALGEMIGAMAPLLPVLTGPLVVALRAVTDVVVVAARGIAFLAAELKDLLGVVDAGTGTGLDTFKPGSSQGLAVRNVTSGDLGGMIRRAQESALQSGRPAEENYPKVSAGYLAKIEEHLSELPQKLGDVVVNAIRQGKIGQAAGRVGRAMDETPPIAGFLSREVVRMITG